MSKWLGYTVELFSNGQWFNIDQWHRHANGELRHRYLYTAPERDIFSSAHDELALSKERICFSDLAAETQDIICAENPAFERSTLASFVTAKDTVTKGTKLPESRTVIRKLSFAPRSRAALSLSMAAQFLRCRGTLFFGYSGAFFGRPRSLFSLTTAAQNVCDLRHRSCGYDYLDFLQKQP